MSWVLGVLGVVALYGAFSFMNGALEQKRDCHGCPEERQTPACETCPLAAGSTDAARGRARLSLVRGDAGGPNVS